MPKLEVKDRDIATLTLEPHDVWFIKAMLEEFYHERQVMSAQEAMGTTEYSDDFIDDIAQELAKALEGQ
jgi:hypothetical protein